MSTHRRRSYRDFADMSGFEIELPSSPDPLGDDDDDAPAPPMTARAPPSTSRRLLPSTASSRFSALPGTSPRKRMFALDVGNEITPQTIFVTIEAGQDGNPSNPKAPVGSSVRRRLFGSPTPSQASPQRRIRTTTTTVPLRGLTDDEGDPTPRRRRRSSGRPGTPSAASAKKPTTTRKKKGTPTPKAKSARKPRGTPTNPSSDIIQSETPAPAPAEGPTPAKRRGRPPKRKPDDAAASELGDPSSIQTLPRKRGRKVRESLGPDQLALLSTANDGDHTEPRDGGISPSTTSDVLGRLPGPDMAHDELAGEQEGDDEDIWMSNAPDTPAAAVRQHISVGGDDGLGFSESAEIPYDEQEPPELEDQGLLPGEFDDYAPLNDYDDRSDEENGNLPDNGPGGADLEDQGPLPGGSDDIAPRRHLDRSDGGNEKLPEVRHEDTQLEDQGPLPGESNDIASGTNYDDKSDRGSEYQPKAQPRRTKSKKQRVVPGKSGNPSPSMDHGEKIQVDSRHYENRPGNQRDAAERDAAELEDQGPLPGESDDYAPIMDYDDRSEAGSSHGKHSTDEAEAKMDLTVDPDTFTMIGLENMASFRASRDAPTSEMPEMGDETSLFINKTLDSLRQEIAESDEDEVDILVSRGNTPAEQELERPAAAIPSPRDHIQVPHSPADRSARYSSRSPGRTESEPESFARTVRRYYPQSPAQPVQRTGAVSPHSEASEIIDDDDDSFSDIPDEVLAAAGSQDDWQPSRGPTMEQLRWAASITKQNLGGVTNYGPVGSVDGQTGGRRPGSHSTPARSNPALTDPDATISQRSVSRSVQSRRLSGQATQRSSPPHSARSRADSNRLLTPDDTTSSSAGVQSPAADPAAHDENERPAMIPDDIGSSPPQITTFAEDDDRPMLPARRNSDTPANRQPEIHVQHVQERHTFAAILPPVQQSGLRPTLSPVVRIGRTLQNILSDPPSPSGRSSVLGSPFKGSARNSSPLDGAAVDEALRNAAISPDHAQQGQSSQGGPRPSDLRAQSSAKSWAMSFAPLSQIKHLVTQGAQLFTSPQVSSSQVLEDPFGPSSPTASKGEQRHVENNGGSAFMDRIRDASREGSTHSSRRGGRVALGEGGPQRAVELSPATQNGVAGRTQPADSRMGNPGYLGSNLQGDVDPLGYDGAFDDDEEELAGKEAYDEPIDNDQTEDEYMEEEQAENEHMDDEPMDDDRTEDEQMDDEQMTEDQAAKDHLTDERTAKDPQSWQLDDVRAEPEDAQVDDDDETQLDSAPVIAEESEEEDIWAVEANRTASSPQPIAQENELSNLFRKSELSVDWGTSTNSLRSARPVESPASKPGRSVREEPLENLEDYSLVELHSDPSTQPSAKKPTSQEARDEPKRVDLSDFFSSSPNFIERQRRAKEASLAKSAAQKAAANAARVASPKSAMTSQAQNSGLSSLKPPPSANRHLMGRLPSPATGASQDTTRESTRESTTRKSPTPEPADIPQVRDPYVDSSQMNGSRVGNDTQMSGSQATDKELTPERGRNDAALFESWSASSSRPPTGQPPSSDPSHFARPSTPPEQDATDSSFVSPNLRPLPGRAASPAKSCLRSPLKPRTPGRVVEFTSSTASETAPFQVNAGSQNKAIPVAPVSNVFAGSVSFPGKENRPSSLGNNVHWSAQDKHIQQVQQQQQQQKVVESPLSQTRWTRRHWVLLDELLQAHRHSPLEFELRHSDALMTSPRRRPSSALLGKQVTSQGESLLLAQWHLDVVDAFKKQVGGWPEDVLAKRLFALIVGEERRRLGLVPRRR